MKKPILLILLCTGLSVMFIFNKENATKNTSSPSPHKQETKKISGAYEALNFMGARQTFPSGVLPDNAYSGAWETMQRMPVETSQRFEIEPWESIGPHNRGGRTLALAFNPQNENTLYAGSASGGLWRSYSAGVGIDAWEQVGIDLPVLGVSCITFAPGDSMTMFIGTGEVYNYFEAGTGAAYRNTRGSFGIGILKSSDGGVTWEKSLDWSFNENHGIWAIRIAPSNPEIMYAATTQGVYKSIDGGDNWELKHNVVMANDLLIHPDNPNLVIVGCGNLNSTGSGVYRTVDGGENWTQIFSELPAYKGKVQFGASPSHSDVIYASIGNSLGGDDQASWLCYSSDFGLNWQLKNIEDYSKWQGWFSHDVAVHPNNPNEITVIGINVWKSTDAGSNILQVSSGGVGFANPPIEGPDGEETYVHSDAHDVIYHPTNPDIIYVASDGGIHRSLDGGTTFASCNGRYQTAQFYNGFSNSQQDPTFSMGGLQDNGTIRWNGDKTWTRVLGGDGSWTAINTENDDIFYASWQYSNIRRTIDGGEIWSDMENPFQWVSSFIAPYAVAPSNPNVLYAASAIVGKTIDGGENWGITNNGNTLDPNSTPILSMAISHQSANVVYAATAPYNDIPSKVFRTINGNNWTEITGSNLPNRYPMDMAVDPTNHSTAYITYAGFGSGHVFKTTDLGSNWTDISTDLPDVPTNAVIVDPLFPSNVYVGNDLGVFVSPDGGETWEVYQEGLPGTAMVFDLKISPSNRKLRVATHGNGAYERDLIEISTAVKDIAWADDLKIKIYPNPTTDIANVTYTLQNTSLISLNLLDANGKTIQTILEKQQSAGQHEVNIQTNKLPSGLYYLQMQLEKEQILKKIVVE